MTACNTGVARTLPLAEPPEARTCGACALWRVIPGEGEIFGECACAEARDALGTDVCPRADFGCRFHVPRDPAAHRAALVAACARALYTQRYGRFSGRNTMPKSFEELLPYTREILEIETIRVLQAAGVLP